MLELLAASLDVTVPEGDDQVYDAAKETGRRRAEQGIPLDAVLRSFRLGGRLIWEDLHHQVTTGGELDVDGLREAGTRLWVVVDATSAQVAAAYHAAERAMLRADDQRRAALWEDVMGGRAQDRAFAREAARILDVPMAGPMLVLALDGPGFLDTVELEHALAALPLRATFARRSDTVIGLLFTGDLLPGPVIDVVRKLTTCAVRVSSVIGGLPATDRGLAQATVALQTLAGRPGVALFDECLPKYGCGINVCKACTSHINGRAFNPCAVRVADISPDDEITTIEGLADTVPGDLHPMQQAWLDGDVAQCGYCQPGQIMAAVALVKKVRRQNRSITESDLDAIRNVCRCGTYTRIRKAIRDGASRM